MKYLALAAFGAPLSILALYTAYCTIFIGAKPTATKYILALILSAITIRANVSLIKSYLFERRAQSLGCAPPTTFPHKDPILGLDTFFEGLRALKEHKLLELFEARFAKHGQSYYNLVLGRWFFSTNEPENIKAILGSNMDDFPIDGPRLWATRPVLGPRSVFSSNGGQWHQARAMIRPSFVRDQVADLQHFNRHIENFLRVVPRDGSTFDIQELMQKMTMDSSTDFMLGYSTNSLLVASPEAQQFLNDFDFASEQSAKVARLGPALYFLLQRKLEEVRDRMRQYILFYLKMAVAEKPKKKDRGYVFLDAMLESGEPEDYLVDQILSIIIAGRDTTAAAMSALFYYLARDPAAVQKLRKEIQDLAVETPTWEQLRQMKYLNNIIREALRLFPPISTNSRSSNKETVLPRGGGPDGKQPVLIPKGTPVRWSSYSLHRRKDVYGPDADEFRPERWESLRVGWEYIPFSGGPRICLGQQFALTQMAYILYKFFKVFRTIEACESGPLLIRANLSASFANGCLVKVTPV